MLGTIPPIYTARWTKVLDITVTRAYLNQTGIASYLRKYHSVLAFQPISASPAWGALAYAYPNIFHAGRGYNTLYQSRKRSCWLLGHTIGAKPASKVIVANW